MRIFILTIAIFIAFTHISCHSRMIPARSVNTEITDENGNSMLLGACTRHALETTPFSSWYNKNYKEYVVDSLVCNRLKKKLRGKNFEIFMGTWCSDSKREVPRMFKILDYCRVSPDKIKLVMLSNQDSAYKQSPQHEERGLNIHRVPDLLVFGKDKELGRIIETPVVSLEKDLLSVVADGNYEPHYKVVAELNAIFEKDMPGDSDDELSALAERLRQRSKSAAELNTYGYVKMAAGEMGRAERIFRINALLYPGDANVFDSLGDFYKTSGNKMLAISNYDKSLELSPINDATRKKLAQLQNN